MFNDAAHRELCAGKADEEQNQQYEQHDRWEGHMASELVDAVRASAARLGISPSDLLTAMHYESGLNPHQWGGAGGNYYGLIQMGPEERRTYGLTPGPGTSTTEQVEAAERYLTDRGLKPGMGMLDIYSTINAGRPGLYNRSDADNGGLPGTVADKVSSGAMLRSRAVANSLLSGGTGEVPASKYVVDSPSSPPAAGGAKTSASTDAPVSDAAVPAGGEASSLSSSSSPFDPSPTSIGQAVASMANKQQGQGIRAPAIDVPQPLGLPMAQKLAQIMQRLQVGNG